MISRTIDSKSVATRFLDSTNQSEYSPTILNICIYYRDRLNLYGHDICHMLDILWLYRGCEQHVSCGAVGFRHFEAAFTPPAQPRGSQTDNGRPLMTSL
jgi:hypothetical protein